MTRKRVVMVTYFGMMILLSVATACGAGGLTRISDGVYAYTSIKSQSPGNRFGANAGIVIGDDGLLVVDTLTSAKEAALFLADIRKITDKPVRYVINTHYHLDHAFGNCVFADAGAIVISHTNCRNRIMEIENQALETAKSFGLTDAELEGTRIVVPAMAFKQMLELDLGHRVVRLLYSGSASHTTGSVFVAIPGQKVVFAGDTLFTDFHPFLAEGDLKGWAKTLDELLGLGAEKIIPGHGPLSGSKEVQEMKAYLKAFDQHARSLCATTTDIEQITAEMIKRLPPRADGQFLIQANIQARYLKSGQK
jgi:glyoxylase-like metal-dependent hydrolase (beta-lactamase superfamily II)